MENYFLDHTASTKFVSDPAQEPHDSRQAFPPMSYVVAPSKNHPILQCRSGLPVETCHGLLPVRITIPVTGSQPVTGQMTRPGKPEIQL